MSLGMEIAKKTIGKSIGIPVMIAAGVAAFIFAKKKKGVEKDGKKDQKEIEGTWTYRDLNQYMCREPFLSNKILGMKLLVLGHKKGKIAMILEIITEKQQRLYVYENYYGEDLTDILNEDITRDVDFDKRCFRTPFKVTEMYHDMSYILPGLGEMVQYVDGDCSYFRNKIYFQTDREALSHFMADDSLNQEYLDFIDGVKKVWESNDMLLLLGEEVYLEWKEKITAEGQSRLVVL